MRVRCRSGETPAQLGVGALSLVSLLKNTEFKRRFKKEIQALNLSTTQTAQTSRYRLRTVFLIDMKGASLEARSEVLEGAAQFLLDSQRQSFASSGDIV